MLRRYDTLIIDEAHERSLNIDFLLGYLKQLLPRRPDLKVIITSATIDPDRFAAHFGGAPVIEVSGRTYPVEVRYRPADEDAGRPGARRSPPRSTSSACRGARRHPGLPLRRAGDPGHRGRAARRHAAAAPRCCRCTPGCPRPSSTGSSTPHARPRGSCWPPTSPRPRSPCPASGTWSTRAPRGSPATARGPRCSGCRSSRSRRRRRNQRKGRCGRPSDGICIRLYAEEDFDARPRVHRARRSCGPTWPR